MFSFFRRKKSQDEGDKRDKLKSKDKSGSPFFKRKEHKKNDASAVQKGGDAADKIGSSDCSNEVVYSELIDKKNLEPVCDPSFKDNTNTISVPDKTRDCIGEGRPYCPIDAESEKNHFVELSAEQTDKPKTRDTEKVVLNKNATDILNGADPSEFKSHDSKEPKHSGGAESSFSENKFKFASSKTSVDNYSDTTVDLTVFVARKTADPRTENENTDEKLNDTNHAVTGRSSSETGNRVEPVHFRPIEEENPKGKDVDKAMEIRSWMKIADPFTEPVPKSNNIDEKQSNAAEEQSSKVENCEGVVDVRSVGQVNSEIPISEGEGVEDIVEIITGSKDADSFRGTVPKDDNVDDQQNYSNDTSKESSPTKFESREEPVGVYSVGRLILEILSPEVKNVKETVGNRSWTDLCGGSVPKNDASDGKQSDTNHVATGSSSPEAANPVETAHFRSIEGENLKSMEIADPFTGFVPKNDNIDEKHNCSNDAAEGIPPSKDENHTETVDVHSIREINSEISTSLDKVDDETVLIESHESGNGYEEGEENGINGSFGVSGGVDDADYGTPDNLPTPERRVGDQSEADIFEEAPSTDSVDVSRECPSNERAPHGSDSRPPSSFAGSEEYSALTPTQSGEGREEFTSGRDIILKDVTAMTYEIEERGKTDGIGDGGSRGYGDCERVSDRVPLSKIETVDGRDFADFFAGSKTKYENGEVNGIDNPEIDGTDIDADGENNSEAVPVGTVSDGPENVSDRRHSSGDYNASDGENTCEATVKIGNMSGVLMEVNEEEEEEDRIVKRVRWADIEGGTELCCADSASEYASEEESDEEDEKQNVDCSSEEESSESEDEREIAECKTSVAEESTAVEVKRENASESDPTESGSTSEEETSEESSEESDDENRTHNSIQLKEAATEESTEEMSYRDGETPDLYNQIAELQHNLMAKTTGMERLQNDLESAYNESELARKRYRRLQDELEACKRCNVDLIDRVNKQAESANNRGIIEEEKLKEADERIKDLERKLAIAKEETARLHNSIKKLEKERNEEMRIVQQALDDALEEQHKMETKFGREFEQLRTLNTNRELKLIDDFEWKLREVEKSCKKQIQEKEKVNDQKTAELCMKLSSAEAELANVAHLKACDSELQQLRSISHDQKKTIRTLNRRLADIQVNEKVLQEETNRLKSALETEKANFSTIQTLHKEDLAEKDRRLHFRLDMQKKHLNSEWEEKLHRECTRLKSELEKTFLEEKRSAVETAKHLKDQENQQIRQIWEKRVQELLREVENLKRKLAQKEENHKYDLENAQSKYDSDILELRRKMDKLDMKYQEQIEKMQEDHEKEIAKVTEECERKIQQTEANLHMQAGTTRATLELVKQQMQKDAEIRIQELKEVHQKELEVQWHHLMEEKDKELKDVQEKHKETVEQFKNEIAALRKKSGSREENQNKPSSSGLGKTLKGLFEKKDSSNQSHTETVNADKSERVGLDKEERTDHRTNRNQSTEQSENTKDNQPKKQVDDNKQTVQSKQQQGQKESGNSRNQPYTRQNSRRSRKSKSGRR